MYAGRPSQTPTLPCASRAHFFAHFLQDEELCDFAQTFFNRSAVGHKVSVRCGNAAEVLVDLRANGGEEGDDDARFCLSYVDADKKRTLALHELLVGAPSPLLRLGGLCVVDNVLYRGEVQRAAERAAGTRPPLDEPRRGANIGAALHEFLVAARDDERVTQLVLPMWDGVSILQRRR